MLPSPPGRRQDDLFSGTRTDPANFDRPDLVLIQTPGWGIKTMPLSLATLSSYIRFKGHRVLPLDLNIEFYLKRRPPFMDVWDDNQAEWFWRTGSCIEDFIAGHKDLIDGHIERLLGTGAKLFGFSCYSSCSHVSLHYARELKRRRPDVVTVFGGPHVSRTLAGRDVASQPGVDLVAQGEGELILLEIVERVKAGKDLSGIAGTLHQRAGGAVVDNGDRPLIRDLDELPFAALEDYDPALYERATTLPVMASRGCPNKCNYCSEKVYWGTYRGFSPRRVADEVAYQLERYPQLTELDFMDSLINGVMSRMLEMARLFIAHPRKFVWTSQAVIRKEMTRDVFKTLYDSGCRCLAFGLETSSAELMLKSGKVLAKGVDVDRLVEDAHAAGLSCAYNFMFGLPGESADNAAASLRFLRKHRDRIGSVNPSAAFCGFSPGTPAYDDPDAFGVVPDRSGHEIYWETKDGTNNLLVRLERFEAFCALALELKVHTTYPHPRLLDRNRLIANYYRHHRRYAEAIPYYDLWLRENPNDNITRRARIQCAFEGGGPLMRLSGRVLTRLAGLARRASSRLRPG